MDAASRSRYERRVHELAGSGHRGSATDSERQAAIYLAEELAGLGLEPVTELFTGSRSLGARLLLHIGVAAVGAALLWHLPGLTILLGSVALGSLIVELTTRGRLLGRLIMWDRSCNVMARLASHGGEAKLRLIICGHYDSQRTGIIWSETLWKRLMPMLRRLPAFAQSPFVPITLAMLMQPFVGMAAIVGTDRAFVSVAGASILVIYAVTGILLADWSVGAPVPGARDNASGAAAVLTLGEEWLKGPVDRVEVVLLSTGCEETGLLGAAAWTDKHRAEIRGVPTYFLNLDGLAFGAPRFLGWEIPIVGFPRSYPPRILALCTQVAAERDLSDAGPCTVAGCTDGLAFLVRGVPGVTVVGTRDDGRLPHWHRRTDDLQRMDFDAAWRGVEFASGLMQKLAALS